VNSMSDLFHEHVPENYIDEVFRVMVEADWHVFQVLTKRPERFGAVRRAAPNIWLGVSVEDRKSGVPRINALREAHALRRFLSIEPLLEDLGELDLSGIDWVIVGGESGRGARPIAADWVRSIRDQCAAAKVPFFFKQWGGVNKKAAGCELDGRTHLDFPRDSVRARPDHKGDLRRRAEARVAELMADPLVQLRSWRRTEVAP